MFQHVPTCFSTFRNYKLLGKSEFFKKHNIYMFLKILIFSKMFHIFRKNRSFTLSRTFLIMVQFSMFPMRCFDNFEFFTMVIMFFNGRICFYYVVLETRKFESKFGPEGPTFDSNFRRHILRFSGPGEYTHTNIQI